MMKMKANCMMKMKVNCKTFKETIYFHSIMIYNITIK